MPVHNGRLIARAPDAHPARALADLGPIIQCEVGLPAPLAVALTNANIAVPARIPGRLLVDTGASSTCISSAVLEQLGLKPVGKQTMSGATGRKEQGLYLCSVAFPGSRVPTIPIRRVAGVDLDAQPYIGLLGRDILATCVFLYNGTTGAWSLSF